MTRAEYILFMMEDLETLKKERVKKEKIEHRDKRDARALNRAFGTQFAALGGAGLYKAHKAAKAGGLYDAAKRKIGAG
jgi:hypothetical protein